MITNIAIATVWVKDVDARKAFYLDVLGFEEHTDLTLGDGYRWCTVSRPPSPSSRCTSRSPDRRTRRRWSRRSTGPSTRAA